MVQVEVAGERIPPVIRLVPDEVRTVASYIIEKCALESGGPYGGFGTGNLGKIKEWIVSPEGDLDKPQRMSPTFLPPLRARKTYMRTLSLTSLSNSILHRLPHNHNFKPRPGLLLPRQLRPRHGSLFREGGVRRRQNPPCGFCEGENSQG